MGASETRRRRLPPLVNPALGVSVGMSADSGGEAHGNVLAPPAKRAGQGNSTTEADTGTEAARKTVVGGQGSFSA